jgi:hypothetical protein
MAQIADVSTVNAILDGLGPFATASVEAERKAANMVIPDADKPTVRLELSAAKSLKRGEPGHVMFKFHTHAAAVVNIQIEVSHIFERAVRTGREAIERAWRKQLDQLFPEKDQKAFKTKRGQIEARDRAAALRYCTWSDPEVDVLAVPSTRNPSRATSRAPSAAPDAVAAVPRGVAQPQQRIESILWFAEDDTTEEAPAQPMARQASRPGTQAIRAPDLNRAAAPPVAGPPAQVGDKRARTPGRPTITIEDYSESGDDGPVRQATAVPRSRPGDQYHRSAPVRTSRPDETHNLYMTDYTREAIRDAYPCGPNLSANFGCKSVRALAADVFKLLAFPDQNERFIRFLREGHIDLITVPPLKLRNDTMRTDPDFAPHFYEVLGYCTGSIQQLTPGGRKMLSEVIALFFVLVSPMGGLPLRTVYLIASQSANASMMMDQSWRSVNCVSAITRKLESQMHTVSGTINPSWPMSTKTGWDYTTRDEFVQATESMVGSAVRPVLQAQTYQIQVPTPPRQMYPAQAPRPSDRNAPGANSRATPRSTVPLVPRAQQAHDPKLLCMQCGRKEGHFESQCPHPRHFMLQFMSKFDFVNLIANGQLPLPS